MPKIEKKQKLGPEQRSQIAKDRWAKIKAAKAQDNPDPVKEWVDEAVSDGLLSATSDIPAPPSVAEGLSGTPINTEPYYNQPFITPPVAEPVAPVAPMVEVPAAQLTPVAPKKPKRYTGPKEFSGALKAAEKRLAKAINERAEAMGKLAGLNAEIPSLLQIIQALKGSNNLPPTPFDFSGGVPNAQAFQAPIDPQAALMAAMAAPPVSRASGGAVQFSPDVVGSLEGPDDDNPDKFLEGPHAGGGWIGG